MKISQIKNVYLRRGAIVAAVPFMVGMFAGAVLLQIGEGLWVSIREACRDVADCTPETWRCMRDCWRRS